MERKKSKKEDARCPEVPGAYVVSGATRQSRTSGRHTFAASQQTGACDTLARLLPAPKRGFETGGAALRAGAPPIQGPANTQALAVAHDKSSVFKRSTQTREKTAKPCPDESTGTCAIHAHAISSASASTARAKRDSFHGTASWVQPQCWSPATHRSCSPRRHGDWP